MSIQDGAPPVRIGVIGAGRMGRRHADFVSRSRSSVVTAVADPMTSALADELGVRSFTDHRELLGSGLVDAVIIANPNALHVQTALDAVAAGVPTLLEKPVATSLDEALELARAVEREGTPVLVGHHRRHHPAVAAARAAISDGILGDVVVVNGVWASRKDDAYFDIDWHREPGAGVMLINVVHDLDLLRHLFGEITLVQAITSSAVRRNPVDDSVSLGFVFESGAIGSFVASDAAVSPWTWDQGTEDDPAFPYTPDAETYFIAGTRASLTLPKLHVHGAADPGRRADWNSPLDGWYLPSATGDAFTHQLEHFVSVARAQAAPLVTVTDAARTQAVVEAVLLSAAQRRPIAPVLPEIAPARSAR